MKTYIIEDEPHAQRVLRELIKRLAPDIEILGIASSVQEGIRLLRTATPDFIFLDINLGQSSGFELLKAFPAATFDIIFVTAYHEYALEAFEWNAIHYITKPINSKTLGESLDRVRKKKASIAPLQLDGLFRKLKNGNAAEEIILKYNNIVELQPIKNIIRLEANGSLTFFYCLEKDLLTSHRTIKRKAVSANLGRYAKLLPEQFYRCHQSHLINRKFVKLYNRGENYLLLHDLTQIPVSRKGRIGLDLWLQGVAEIK